MPTGYPQTAFCYPQFREVEGTMTFDKIVPDADNTYDFGDGTIPKRWKDVHMAGILYNTAKTNGNSIQLGDATHEGGDITAYSDTSASIGFQLDADANKLTLGTANPVVITGTVNADALTIGASNKEGGDITVYGDGSGTVAFKVDADALDVTVGDNLTAVSAVLSKTNADALTLGGASAEGGDITVYADGSGTIAFKVDADALDVTVGDNLSAVSATLSKTNGDALVLGGGAAEGGDFKIYSDGSGNIAFAVDADGATPISGTAASLTSLALSTKDADSLVLGGGSAEGGDFKIYSDASGNLAFSVDADGATPISGTAATLGTLALTTKDATSLSLGSGSTEGGDLIIYSDTKGTVAFGVDADALTTTLGGTLSGTSISLSTVDADALVLGAAKAEGGDIKVYSDASGTVGLSYDADGQILTLQGANATVLSLGDSTHEGGNFYIYADGSGSVALSVDADAASTRMQYVDVTKNVTIYGLTDQMTLRLGTNANEGGDFYAYYDGSNHVGLFLDTDGINCGLLPLATASGSAKITIAGASGRIRKDAVHFEDDFLGKDINDENVWRVSGTNGTATITADVAGGELAMQTVNATNNDCQLDFNGKRMFAFSKNVEFEVAFHQTVDTQVEIQMGFYNDATHYCYFAVDSGETAANWYGSVHDGTTPTSTDSTVLSDTSAHVFRIRCISGHVYFDIDGVNKVDQSTNLPTTELWEPFLHIKTTADVDAGLHLDYVKIWQDR